MQSERAGAVGVHRLPDIENRRRHDDEQGDRERIETATPAAAPALRPPSCRRLAWSAYQSQISTTCTTTKGHSPVRSMTAGTVSHCAATPET